MKRITGILCLIFIGLVADVINAERICPESECEY